VLIMRLTTLLITLLRSTTQLQLILITPHLCIIIHLHLCHFLVV